MDYFYIFMVVSIFTFLITMEVQIHTLKTLVEKYIEIRLNPEENKIGNILCKDSEKPLTKK